MYFTFTGWLDASAGSDTDFSSRNRAAALDVNDLTGVGFNGAESDAAFNSLIFWRHVNHNCS